MQSTTHSESNLVCGQRATHTRTTYAHSPGAAIAFSTQSADYDGGVEYFDVYSPEIRTRYSQVFWTMMDAVPLPPDLVARFDGKVMAITGSEMDQVGGCNMPFDPACLFAVGVWRRQHSRHLS
jgi:hypothetical protein